MRYLLILLIGILSSIHLNGQNIQGGAIGGLNFSQVDGDQFAGFHKVGMNVGLIAEIPLKEKWSMSMEFLYSEKGSLNNNLLYPNSPFKMAMNYVDVPILLNFHDKNKFVFGAGLAYCELMDYKAEVKGFDVSKQMMDDYKDWGLDWIMNFRLKTQGHFQYNIRYTYSFINLSTRSGDNRHEYVQARHNFVSFRVYFMLGKHENDLK